MLEELKDIGHFFIAGINYKKSDASTRSCFAIDSSRYAELLQQSASFGIHECFVLSTCNRTEIVGFAPSACNLVDLFCNFTGKTKESFLQQAYVYQGKDAINHLFTVGVGLDSQILGDYEIVGQLKKAVKIAKEQHCVGAYLERLVNDVLQAAKKVRTHTELSSGTVSVSFAAVQYLRLQLNENFAKNILLIGTGKIGTNLCKNLVTYLPGCNITVYNRSQDKANALANQLPVTVAPMDGLQDCINAADIIVVATSADKPVLNSSHLKDKKPRIVIDMSVPCNVCRSVRALPQVTMQNVDELSRVKDETLQLRRLEVPKALAIVAEQVDAFLEWHEMRRHVPLLKQVKHTLHRIHSLREIENSADANALTRHNNTPVDHTIQKLVGEMAVRMRSEPQHGCLVIETMNDFLLTAPHS